MDEKNREIIDYLKKDGRASFTDIADSVGVSEGTVRNRLKRMREEGVIKGFTVETGTSGISAVVMVKLSTGVNIDHISDQMPENSYFHEVTGDYDLIIELDEETTEALNDEIDSIRALEGVEDTKTYSVLNQGRF